jgi:hypothetical protein
MANLILKWCCGYATLSFPVKLHELERERTFLTSSRAAETKLEAFKLTKFKKVQPKVFSHWPAGAKNATDSCQDACST